MERSSFFCGNELGMGTALGDKGDWGSVLSEGGCSLVQGTFIVTLNSFITSNELRKKRRCNHTLVMETYVCAFVSGVVVLQTYFRPFFEMRNFDLTLCVYQ